MSFAYSSDQECWLWGFITREEAEKEARRYIDGSFFTAEIEHPISMPCPYMPALLERYLEDVADYWLTPESGSLFDHNELKQIEAAMVSAWDKVTDPYTDRLGRIIEGTLHSHEVSDT